MRRKKVRLGPGQPPDAIPPQFCNIQAGGNRRGTRGGDALPPQLVPSMSEMAPRKTPGPGSEDCNLAMPAQPCTLTAQRIEAPPGATPEQSTGRAEPTNSSSYTQQDIMWP